MDNGLKEALLQNCFKESLTIVSSATLEKYKAHYKVSAYLNTMPHS